MISYTTDSNVDYNFKLLLFVLLHKKLMNLKEFDYLELKWYLPNHIVDEILLLRMRLNNYESFVISLLIKFISYIEQGLQDQLSIFFVEWVTGETD